MASLSAKVRILLCSVGLLYYQTILNAQNIDSLLRNKRIYNAVSIGDLPVPRIDGLLEDTIWSLGAWQGEFIQQFPYGGRPASERSYIKILYDRSNLYVAIICQDSEPELIRDILGRRDARGGDNAGIAIDSYFDKRTAFEFSMTAAGQKMDLKHLGDYRFDFNWDGVWDGASFINDTAWIAEMQIPFSQLRYANTGEHTWGLHIYRVISRKSEASSWQYIPREAPAMVYLFGELHGISQIRSSRQVELLPYALGSLSRIRGTDPLNDFAFNAGVDAKVGISSDYTLDLSVNPDFGQVEADPSVLNLTSFEIFYQEKRPFFLEGNEIFDFEINGDIPYYSRRIGSAPDFPGSYKAWSISGVPDQTTILAAAKLTGKSSKGLSVGLVNGLTAKEVATATGGNGESEELEVAPLTNYMATRIKKDFKQGNTIFGGVFSLVNRISADSAGSDLLPTSAISGGLDLLHHWQDRNYFLEIKSIASQLNGSPEAILIKQLAHNHRFQRPDAGYLEVDSLREHLSGHGSLISAGKKGGKWTFYFQGEYRSPGLNLNDMGYIRQSDFFGQRVQVAYEMNEPKNWIRDYTFQLYQEAQWSFGGENTGSRVGAGFQGRNNALWRAGIALEYNFSRLDTRELRGGPALRNDPMAMAEMTVTSNTARDLYASAAYEYTHFGRKAAGMHEISASMTWLPIKRLSLSAQARFNRRDYHQQYVATLPSTPLSEYIVGRIAHHTTSFTFRGELFLTPELSIQYYGSPYYSVGKFDQFSRVAESTSRDIEDRLQQLEVSYDPEEDTYSYTHDSREFSFDNPDFSFMQFRSNLVFRWEYKLGSTLYLVWAHDRSDWSPVYRPVSEINGELFGIPGNNVVMVKFNYWFSL
jgi:hypothetical protein